MVDSNKIPQPIKLKGYVGPDRKLTITESPSELPEGNVDVILLYPRGENNKRTRSLLHPSMWPTLDGRQYLGGTLSREEIYEDDGR